MNSDFIYTPGDIISVKNIIFKDTNIIDTRINGHPMIVINEVKKIGDEVLLIKLSGNYGPVDQLDNYYPLRAGNETGLRKASYADLRFLYSQKCVNIQPISHICEKEYNKIIKKLENNPNCLIDEDYKKWRSYVDENNKCV